ncbi:MAG: hypothetical protein KBD16_01765 [Candidatus Pacebacteria bacterium]|nr:hypothetical protein [Candidatus Paceibacterota bacterium]
MNTLRPILTVVVLLVILFLMIALSGHRVDTPSTSPDTATTTNTTPEPTGVGITVLDSFAEGVHTYAFDLFLPTPCHSLSKPDVLVRESYPEQIGISYSVIAPPAGTMCTQVISRVPVSVDATASEGARLTSITLNGTPISFTVESAN